MDKVFSSMRFAPLVWPKNPSHLLCILRFCTRDMEIFVGALLLSPILSMVLSVDAHILELFLYLLCPLGIHLIEMGATFDL